MLTFAKADLERAAAVALDFRKTAHQLENMALVAMPGVRLFERETVIRIAAIFHSMGQFLDDLVLEDERKSGQ